MYRRAGLLPQSPDGAAPMQAASSPGAAVCCVVCMSDVPPSQATTMDCGHAFCNGCWREHMRIGISEGLSRRLRCMAPSCGVVCNEDKVRRR